MEQQANRLVQVLREMDSRAWGTELDVWSQGSQVYFRVQRDADVLPFEREQGIILTCELYKRHGSGVKKDFRERERKHSRDIARFRSFGNLVVLGDDSFCVGELNKNGLFSRRGFVYAIQKLWERWPEFMRQFRYPVHAFGVDIPRYARYMPLNHPLLTTEERFVSLFYNKTFAHGLRELLGSPYEQEMMEYARHHEHARQMLIAAFAHHRKFPKLLRGRTWKHWRWVLDCTPVFHMAFATVVRKLPPKSENGQERGSYRIVANRFPFFREQKTEEWIRAAEGSSYGFLNIPFFPGEEWIASYGPKAMPALPVYFHPGSLEYRRRVILTIGGETLWNQFIEKNADKIYRVLRAVLREKIHSAIPYFAQTGILSCFESFSSPKYKRIVSECLMALASGDCEHGWIA